MAYELHMRDDGILQISRTDSLDRKELETFLKDVAPFLEAATEAKPLLVLLETHQERKPSSRARKTYAQLSHDPRVEKVAILGSHRYVPIIVGFIQRAVGGGNQRFFESKEEAIAWLKAER
jgi:hypothetical protein